MRPAKQVEGIGSPGFLVPSPFFNVCEGFEAGVLDTGDVNGESFLPVPVEVLVEGGDDALTVVLEHPPCLTELFDAPFKGFGGVRFEGVGDDVEGLFDMLDRGISRLTMFATGGRDGAYLIDLGLRAVRRHV